VERELLLLGILRAQRMHGYQLNDFLERRYDFVTDLKPSTAYYLLDRLAVDGYVQMHYEQVGNRPQRRVYEITPSGEAHFFELLRLNLSGRTPPVYADEVGLAFIDELSLTETLAALHEKRQLLQAEMERLSAFENAMRTGGGGRAQRALDHHLTLVRAELTWLDTLLTELTSRQEAQ
jgi:DNA-binding PadR family transcriptional regulator